MNGIRKSLATFWPSIRISFVLVSMTISLVLFADLAGLMPNPLKYELENRKQLSESLAILSSTMASQGDIKKVRTVLTQIVQREEDFLSAGFRMQSGRLLFQAGPHDLHWADYNDNKSTSTHVVVPIFRKNRPLGTIELSFKPLSSSQGIGFITNPTYQLILFIFVFGFFSFLFFMLRTLRQIDPASVVPDRVNAAFDTLSEGLIILDDKEQIVLSNKAFSETVKRPADALIGQKLSKLNWKPIDKEDTGQILYPWVIALSTGKSCVGEMLILEANPNDRRTLTINCAPIDDGKGSQQGILLTFDDVTELEVQKHQLQVTVTDLESSQKEIQRQNKELHFLATRDPLTGCLNRRSFNQQFAESFNHARDKQLQLSFIMADIDFFKKVNDNYGHAVGDDVIKLLADILHASTRDEDIVGRYGGEEFCIVLPGIDADEAVSVAERIRLKVRDESISTFDSGPHITTSLGVSTIIDNAKDPAELNDQSDQALYIAKESGRNRVIKWTAESKSETATPPPSDDQTSDSDSLADNRISISDHAKHVAEVNQLKTQIKQLENAASAFSDQLQHEKNYDKLTGLPNQTLFYDRIKQAIDRGARLDQLTAILVIDFDLFAKANNSFGMEIAEKMFASLTDRLVSVFRKTDSITLFNLDSNDFIISRFDGDKFGILLTDLDDRMIVTWAVKRLFDAMSVPISYEDKQINVTCKVGISIFPEDADSPEELFSHATTAKSFVNKDKATSNFQFYDPDMQKSSLKQLGLEAEIKKAIKNKEWILYYQPKMDITNNTINSFEALIRWNHPERGILSPFEFVDFAEERGLIVEIGDWVLRTACKQAKIWADAGFNMKIAVNLSAVQLRQEKLSSQILKIMNEHQIKPKQLELEVTETMLMNNIDTAINTLKRLHTRGICISIDDFGTGYSSLGYLKHLPIDVLKIDRTFITDIMTDDYDKNIVKTVISMAHGMNLKVIAEGVETVEQYKILQEMSCDEIQGYLISKPVDALSATKFLTQKESFGLSSSITLN